MKRVRRGLLALAALAATPAAAYDDIRLLPSLRLDGMERPQAVAASADRIYALDSRKNALFLYDAEGRLIKSVGRAGSEKSAFSGPKGLCVGPEGRVFVADTGNSRVQVLDADGAFVGSFGSKGSEPGQLRSPESVAAGGDGRVYVADTGNDRVQVFTSEGIYLFNFGSRGKGPGEFRGPTRVAVDPSDFIYALDAGNGRVQKFDPRARFVKQYGLPGSDFAVDAYGFLYVMDAKAGKVREHSPQGALLGAFGSRGSGQGQFKDLSGVAAAPDGSLLVLDRGALRLSRVQLYNKLKTEPLPPSRAAKLFVSGPESSWPFSASALAPAGDLLYAYLPKEGRFAAIDRDGKAALRFGSRGKEPSATRAVRGLAVSQEHGLFAADTGGDKLQRFDLSGKFLNNFAESTGLFDSKKKEGRVRSPQGLAVNEKGVVFVANRGNRRVEAFSHDGTFLFSIGPTVGPHELQEPVAVAWDPKGFLLILDFKLKKVLKCEPSGGFLQAWGEEGTGPGQFLEPVALAHDGLNYVYVLDRGARRVSVFTRDGAWVTNFFASGEDERSLREPEALALREGRLFVSDPGVGRVVSFSLHPRLAPPVSVSTAVAEGVVELRWKPSEDAWASRYRVLRATLPAGPYEPLAAVDKPEHRDPGVAAYQTYYYRVAVEARTGDLGPASPSAAAFVPGSANRPPVEISTVEIGNIFSANYKYYEKNPIGRLVLTNNGNAPYQKVKVSFRLKDFMDFGTDTEVARLEPRESLEIPLKAVLNNRILEVTEDTPIQAEFTLTYFDSGIPLTVSLAKPLRVYSRNAITWDKPERIATFVTSNDTPLKDFERKAMNEVIEGPPGSASVNEALAKALRLWHAVGAHGVRFQPSPNNPFAEISQDPSFPVDATQFPRETLKRRSGECDDLATLFASLLESADVRTAFLDTPGHIALMFDTGASDPLEAGLPETLLIRHDGSLWVPFEATLVGSTFLEAHRHALNMYRELERQGKARVLDPRKAWAVFEPATMPATDWSPEPPKPAELGRRLESDAAFYARERYAFLKAQYREALAKDPKNAEAMNQLGLLEVDMLRPDKAAEEFQKAVEAAPGEAAAWNNLGGVAFLDGDFVKARSYFLKAAEKDPADPGIWLNLAKSSARLKDPEKAREYGEKVRALGADDAALLGAVQALIQ